jgi:hypothetical protein
VTADVDRQVAPMLVQALLRYVRQAGGDAAFDEVVAALQIPLAELESDSRWFSSHEATALADAAARVCHDDSIGIRAGNELWRMLCQHDGYLDLVRSAGTVAEAIAAAARRGSKLSTGRSLAVRDVAATRRQATRTPSTAGCPPASTARCPGHSGWSVMPRS